MNDPAAEEAEPSETAELAEGGSIIKKNNTEEEVAAAADHALSSTVSRNHCIAITFVILLAHGLFLWGQLDLLWAQYVSYSASASISANITSTFIANRINFTSVDINEGNTDDPYLVGEWSYGGMLSELWVYSKVTAVILFVFSAFWPHLKLVLLHVYFYRPVPSKPRRAALYWLDAVGKMYVWLVYVTYLQSLFLSNIDFLCI